MSHSFTARRFRPSPAAASALDFGLRVHVEIEPLQRAIFTGAENFSVR